MKKSPIAISISIILLCCLAFTGCNLDAKVGIFRKVSTSTETKGVRITSAAGYDSASTTAYFITDSGLCKQVKGHDDITVLVANTETMHIKQASFYTNSGVQYIKYLYQNPTQDNQTTIYTSTLTLSMLTSSTAVSTTSGIYAGFEVTDGGKTFTSLQNGGTATLTNLSRMNKVITNSNASSSPNVNALLVYWTDTSSSEFLTLITDNGTTVSKYNIGYSAIDKDIASFACNSNAVILIGKENSDIYYITDITASTEAADSNKNLSDSFSNSPAIGFFDSANSVFYFKGNDAYNSVKWNTAETSFTVDDVTDGFAEGLLESTSGAVKIANDQMLVFTEDSGLFILDLTSNSNSEF